LGEETSEERKMDLGSVDFRRMEIQTGNKRGRNIATLKKPGRGKEGEQTTPKWYYSPYGGVTNGSVGKKKTSNLCHWGGKDQRFAQLAMQTRGKRGNGATA